RQALNVNTRIGVLVAASSRFRVLDCHGNSTVADTELGQLLSHLQHARQSESTMAATQASRSESLAAAAVALYHGRECREPFRCCVPSPVVAASDSRCKALVMARVMSMPPSPTLRSPTKLSSTLACPTLPSPTLPLPSPTMPSPTL